MKYRLMTHIRTPEDLGIACLGNPQTSIVPVSPENRIDRAEYGRRLAELEGGTFTPFGYIVPEKSKGGKSEHTAILPRLSVGICRRKSASYPIR